MLDTPATHLGVVRLSEAGESARDFRLDSGRPLGGYCLISGDGAQFRVTVLLDNARPLGDAPLRYCGWAIADPNWVQLGELTGVGADNVTTLVCPGNTPGKPLLSAIRITTFAPATEPAMGLRLAEGRVIWLQGPPDALWSSAPDLEPGSEPDPALVSAGVGAKADLEAYEAGPGGDPLPDRRPSPDQAAAPVEETLPHSVPEEPDSVPEEPPAVHGFKLYPEPATPVMSPARPPQPALRLQPVQPLAERAAATANLGVADGSLAVYIRGLPSPAAFGADATTGRPCNAFRVWLMDRRTQRSQPVDFCQRIWGDRFQLHATGLPLEGFDALVIAVQDQAAQTNSPGTQILTGSYQV